MDEIKTIGLDLAKQVLQLHAIADRLVDARRVLHYDAAGAEIGVANRGVAHLPVRQPDIMLAGVETRVRPAPHQGMPDRRLRLFDRIVGRICAFLPSVENAQRNGAAGKMLRIALLAVLVLLGAPPVSRAQPPKTIPRLCLLGFRPYALGTMPWIGKFFQALRDLGYVDGRSITIDYLSADGRNEQFPTLAAECVRRKADVIVPATTPAAQAARDATQTIPIVTLPLGDLVGTGLVESLARPGANVTGTTFMATQLAAKRLELLKEAVPGISRVFVLTYLTDPIARLQVRAIKQASRSLGVTLQIHDIRTADDLPAAFDAAAGEGADGLIVTTETILFVNRARVVELASRHRLPAIYPSALFVRAGGLMAFSNAENGDLLRGSARYVDRVLKGEKPADLPIQRPTKFHLLVNLKAAKALDLTISPAFLARANEVTE
jgi:ABC-type uncharacterized transport system substrate-binding protein